MTVINLRSECKKLNLTQSGVKDEVVKRIVTYLFKGTKNRHLNSKTVYQYNKDGIFINEFESLVDAAKSIDSSTASKIKQDCISNACINKHVNTYYGYIWTYKKKEINPQLIQKVNTHSKSRIIIKEDLKGVELQRFKSVKEAANITGINLNTLHDALSKRKQYVRGDFKIKYENENIKRLTTVQQKEIKDKYKNGVKIEMLSEEYSKSVKQLRRVLNS